MRLEPLFDREIEQIKQEYEERIQRERRTLEERIQQERRKYQQSIEGMLRLRFGAVDEELATIIEPLAALPSEEYMALMLQLPDLSREELLTRFRP